MGEPDKSETVTLQGEAEGGYFDLEEVSR